MTIPIILVTLFCIIGITTALISKGHPNAVEKEIEDVSEEIIEHEMGEIIHVDKPVDQPQQTVNT